MSDLTALTEKVEGVLTNLERLSETEIDAVTIHLNSAIILADRAEINAREEALICDIYADCYEDKEIEAARACVKLRRLKELAARLAGARNKLEQHEKDVLRIAQYADAALKRDIAAALIREKYPAIQQDLISLVKAIAEAEELVERANANLPLGAEPLHSAEAVGFNYPDSPKDRTVGNPPVRIAEMMIPDFGNWSTPAWPPGWNNSIHARPGTPRIRSWLRAMLSYEERKTKGGRGAKRGGQKGKPDA